MATASRVHLETLATPRYTDKTASEVMQVLDNMINQYLNETNSILCNVVEYGFNTGKKGHYLSAYARLCVYKTIEVEDKKSNDEVIDVDVKDVLDEEIQEVTSDT